VAFYIYTVFVIAYATRFLQFRTPDVLLIVTGASALQLIGMLLGGWFSDRIGRRPIMIGAAVALAAWAPIFFALAQQRSLPLLAAAVCTGAFLHGLLAGPEAAWVAELFPTGHRVVGTSLAVQGASIFGGGPAPLIATALLGASGNTTAVIVYLVVAALISAVSVIAGPETRGIELDTIGAAKAAS
jgi:MFS family permease